MSHEQFTAWLRGFLDAAGNALTAAQVTKIRERLDAVSPQKYPWTLVQPTTPYEYPYTVAPWHPYTVAPWPYDGFTYCAGTVTGTAIGGMCPGALGTEWPIAQTCCGTIEVK